MKPLQMRSIGTFLLATALFAIALPFEQFVIAQNSDFNIKAVDSDSRLSYGRDFSYGFGPALSRAGLDKISTASGDSTSAVQGGLPDGPGAIAAMFLPSDSGATGPSLAERDHRDGFPPARVAPVYDRYIEPFETAQHLTKTQNMIFGFHQSISPYFLLTILAASGYEQARNSAPNYGTNIGSYGERLGAAAVRNTSQSVFSDSLMAPLLHQDPRFYIQGKQHSVFERTAYAVTRVVVTKSSDDGRLVPNYSQVAGYAEAAALTNAYYPDVNVGFGQTARSLGGSLLGLAFSNVVREFLPDILRVTHLERSE